MKSAVTWRTLRENGNIIWICKSARSRSSSDASIKEKANENEKKEFK